jgi:hypothetical protein
MTQWTPADGTRPPSAHWGSKVMVRLRNGTEPQEPWPIGSTKSGQTQWLWKPDSKNGFDIVAIRRVD